MFHEVSGTTTFIGYFNDRIRLRPKSEQAIEQYIGLRNKHVIRRCWPDGENSLSEKLAFRIAARYYQQGLVHEVPEIFLACLRNALIVSPYFVIMSEDNRVIRDSVWAGFILRRSGVLHWKQFESVVRREGSFCALGLYWWSGHYHWLLDVLPRFSIVEKFDTLNNVPLIVPKGLSKQQRESLSLLGIDNDRIVEYDGEPWRCETLYFPSALGRCGNPTSPAIKYLRSRFWRAVGVGQHQAKARIYVSRNDARTRRVTNEEDLIRFLEERGIVVVVATDSSFAEQVNIFSKASIIIGPHGSGLANMVFAPAGAKVFELFPTDYVNGCYWALANSCGHQYRYMMCRTNERGIEVCLDKLNKCCAVWLD